MGIDYNSDLVVGLTRGEAKTYTVEDVYEEGLELHSFNAYADEGNESHVVIGISVANSWEGCAQDVSNLAGLDLAHIKFKEITGLDGKLYLCTTVS